MAAGLLASATLFLNQPAAALDLRAVDDSLVELEKLGRDLGQRSKFVVAQYSQSGSLNRLGDYENQFSEAELHFLLENFNSAAVYLFDLVDVQTFKASKHYPDALYYLAESLYQQESYLPARGFFERLIKEGGGRYAQDALLRVIEISARLNNYSGVDSYIEMLRKAGGPLRPQVLYVYGKFLRSRKDLPPAVRIEQALQVFSEVPPDSAFDLQARYFMGALYVEAQDLDSAAQVFTAILERPAEGARARGVRELTWIALGRVRYEQGDTDQAIDAYQRVERSSPHFYRSLYEVAWAYVKKNDFENALRACEILMVGAADSPLAPEAQILIGNLYSKQKKYEKALDTYNDVINSYAPVRDEIDALLSLHDDPVTYFNELIRDEGESFEVESILPPVAVKWASTEGDVKRAMEIVKDLESGSKDVVEGRKIGTRIFASLDEGTLEPFPALREGHARGSEISNGIMRLLARLTEVERDLLSDLLVGEERSQLQAVQVKREAIERRFRELPSTQEELEARNQLWTEQVGLVERKAYREKLSSSSLTAQIVAIRKWVHDTRESRVETPEEIESFLTRLDREQASVDALEAEATVLLAESQRLKDEIRSGAAAGPEKDLRDNYQAALANEARVISQMRSRLPSERRRYLDRIDALRRPANADLTRVQDLLASIATRADVRRSEIRRQVQAELNRLDGYETQVSGAAGDSKNLVGRIALDSFRKVQGAFYSLILKADVGIIDVAWSRKSDKSKQIQTLAQEKDRQIRLLDQEFKEVLAEDK